MHPVGWCQDVVDAAMLNLTDEAMALVIERAQQPPAAGWRFGGFAQHYQDYEPSESAAPLYLAIIMMLPQTYMHDMIARAESHRLPLYY